MSEIIKIGQTRDSEQFRELERQAYYNTIDISDFAPAEYKYFDKLREICHEYRQGAQTEADKKLLNERKARYYAEYEEYIDEHLNRVMEYMQQAEFIKRSEALRTEIIKTDDKDKKLSLALECISVMINDGGVFLKAAKKE